MVLDTNVLLRHATRLAGIDWWTSMKLSPHRPVMLGVPLVVIEELDRLKTATGRMKIDDVEVPVKQLAHAVLKCADDWFGHGQFQGALNTATAETRFGDLKIQLVMDDLGHVRLPVNNAEIIDRALALRPFTNALGLATGDRAVRFRAHHAGLDAFDPLPQRPLQARAEE